MTKLAIIQHAPAFLDKPATLDKAAELIGQAAAAGADLIVFPEAYVPGYPAWVWRLRPGGDYGLAQTIHERLLRNAVDVRGDDLAPLQAAARQHEVTVVCGINERAGGTLYNSVATIGSDGTLLNVHRKLMPTNPERMTWGFGDASGLTVVETPAGRLGTLLCWESYMPLARYALYAQDVELYIAPTYDSGDGWIGTMQHIAREGCCWVVSAGTALHRDDIPEDFPDRDNLYPAGEQWVNPGDSVVVAPGGEIVAGPLHNEQGILYANVDSARCASAKRAFDVVGHYARPDVFQLHVNTAVQAPVTFD